MPPDRPRSDSRARAEQALKLKSRGRTWQEIANELGYKSRGSALTAVRRLILREPPEDLETKRTYTAGTYSQSIDSLFRQLAKAEADTDSEAVVSINRAIAYIADKHARLTGQYMPVVQQQEVDVKVEVRTSATAVVDNATQELLAIARGHHDAGLLPGQQMPVLDVEAVEVR